VAGGEDPQQLKRALLAGSVALPGRDIAVSAGANRCSSTRDVADGGTVASTGYDYVVVGGGTAGCVIASRLSENPDVQVVLIEAGSGEPLDAVAVPPAWTSLQGTSVDWANSTVVQRATGTVIPWPRGKVLGGSSAINGMCFIRGHRSSYDAWLRAGARGWGFDDLLPYLRRSERARGRDPEVRGRTSR